VRLPGLSRFLAPYPVDGSKYCSPMLLLATFRDVNDLLSEGISGRGIR
jgi:hypothetical protein